MTSAQVVETLASFTKLKPVICSINSQFEDPSYAIEKEQCFCLIYCSRFLNFIPLQWKYKDSHIRFTRKTLSSKTKNFNNELVLKLP